MRSATATSWRGCCNRTRLTESAPRSSGTSTTALNEEARKQSIRPVPVPSSFEADSVRVERELDYVDITLFFENEGVVIAIENKTGEADPEHAKQVGRL